MTKKLKELFERAAAWPDKAQEEAIASLEAIELDLTGITGLTVEDREALERSAEDVRHGRIADPDDVREVFGRFRQV